MKEILEFIQRDQPGHLERSGEPLRFHADEGSACDAGQRKEYFFGMMAMFPMMFLGHYYSWLTDGTPEVYMDSFVPAQQERFAGGVRKLLDVIYGGSERSARWIAAVSAYLAYYPAELLRAFAGWGFPEQGDALVEAFLQREREQELPGLLRRVADCGTRERRAELVYWLGTEYPFELIGRFHHSVMEGGQA